MNFKCNILENKSCLYNVFKILICRHWGKTGGSWGSLFSSTNCQYGIQQWVKLYIISPTVVMTRLVIKPRHGFAFALFNILLKRLAFRISLFWSFLKERHPFLIPVKINVYAHRGPLRVRFELNPISFGVKDPNSRLFIPDATSWCGIFFERIVVAQLV